MRTYWAEHTLSIIPQRIMAGLGVVAIVIGHPQTSQSQGARLGPRPRWADSTPSRILANTATDFPKDVVIEVLRQRHQPYALAKRRELADLVVARAIAEPRVGTLAIVALSMSGFAEPGLGGIPDPDALGRLIRIQQGATNADERHLALTELVDQVNPSRALPFLRQVAVSSSADDAYWSVMEIGRLAYGVNLSRAEPSERSQAQTLLRELYDQNLVKGRAASLLCENAVAHKWPVAPRCRGMM